MVFGTVQTGEFHGSSNPNSPFNWTREDFGVGSRYRSLEDGFRVAVHDMVSTLCFKRHLKTNLTTKLSGPCPRCNNCLLVHDRPVCILQFDIPCIDDTYTPHFERSDGRTAFLDRVTETTQQRHRTYNHSLVWHEDSHTVFVAHCWFEATQFICFHHVPIHAPIAPQLP